MDSTDISKLNDFKKTLLFKSIELKNDKEEYIGGFDKIQENFNMLFELLPGRDDTIQRLILDYYNNFRVKISYPTEIEIKGKFIIGKNERGYEFDSHEHDAFLLDDFLEQDREQVKAYNIVVMMSLETCKPLYFFDDFLQDNEKLANGKLLKNAEYWRISPQTRQSCTDFNNLVEKREKFKIEVGGKRKKKRIMRTKRKRNKRTRRTKRR
jgi:hypothetical protein